MRNQVYAMRYGILFINLMTMFVLFVGLFYAVPDRWILDYQQIIVKDACTTDNFLSAESQRIPKITTLGRGEDNVYAYPLDGSLPIDRIEWEGAVYRVGTTEDKWKAPLHQPLAEGQYVLVGEPIIKLVFLERAIEPIISLPFTVTVCE